MKKNFKQSNLQTSSFSKKKIMLLYLFFCIVVFNCLDDFTVYWVPILKYFAVRLGFPSPSNGLKQRENPEIVLRVIQRYPEYEIQDEIRKLNPPHTNLHPWFWELRSGESCIMIWPIFWRIWSKSSGMIWSTPFLDILEIKIRNVIQKSPPHLLLDDPINPFCWDPESGMKSLRWS